MSNHDHRGSAVNQPCSTQAFTPLWIDLTAPSIGKTRTQPSRSDLTSQLTFEAIGGITHKMMAAQEAGATVFLVPAENCDEARSMRDDSMELVKVDTLSGAVDSLHTLTSGGRPPTC